MTKNKIEQPSISTSVSDWNARVDQTDPEALATFISVMPFAKTITHDELSETAKGAVELATFGTIGIVLNAGELLGKPTTDTGEKYHCFGGTHASHGNFALFWSVRGPGNSSRPRPCFMFWDDEAIMLNSGYAA